MPTLARTDARVGRPRRNWYKLDWRKVETIRRFRSERGWTTVSLARRYGVHPTHISHICNFNRWSNVS